MEPPDAKRRCPSSEYVDSTDSDQLLELNEVLTLVKQLASASAKHRPNSFWSRHKSECFFAARKLDDIVSGSSNCTGGVGTLMSAENVFRYEEVLLEVLVVCLPYKTDGRWKGGLLMNNNPLARAQACRLIPWLWELVLYRRPVEKCRQTRCAARLLRETDRPGGTSMRMLALCPSSDSPVRHLAVMAPTWLSQLIDIDPCESVKAAATFCLYRMLSAVPNSARSRPVVEKQPPYWFQMPNSESNAGKTVHCFPGLGGFYNAPCGYFILTKSMEKAFLVGIIRTEPPQRVEGTLSEDTESNLVGAKKREWRRPNKKSQQPLEEEQYAPQFRTIARNWGATLKRANGVEGGEVADMETRESFAVSLGEGTEVREGSGKDTKITKAVKSKNDNSFWKLLEVNATAVKDYWEGPSYLWHNAVESGNVPRCYYGTSASGPKQLVDVSKIPPSAINYRAVSRSYSKASWHDETEYPGGEVAICAGVLSGWLTRVLARRFEGSIGRSWIIRALSVLGCIPAVEDLQRAMHIHLNQYMIDLSPRIAIDAVLNNAIQFAATPIKDGVIRRISHYMMRNSTMAIITCKTLLCSPVRWHKSTVPKEVLRAIISASVMHDALTSLYLKSIHDGGSCLSKSCAKHAKCLIVSFLQTLLAYAPVEHDGGSDNYSSWSVVEAQALRSATVKKLGTGSTRFIILSGLLFLDVVCKSGAKMETLAREGRCSVPTPKCLVQDVLQVLKENSFEASEWREIIDK